jgi:tripartite-type tricarboxylate transporter receptor subunit TctC
MIKLFHQFLFIVSFIFGVNMCVAADVYPTRPIRLIVGFSAGGPTDVIARVISKDMSVTLGQPIVVENKAGASSMIATREVRNSAPDGYTLLFSSLGLNVNRILHGEQAGYNPKTDFVPISNVANLPLVAVSAYDSPIRSMPELLKKARTSPDTVSFASSGTGGSGHLASELLDAQAKVKMLHVPYKGNGPALVDVMAGQVDYMFYPVIGVMENVNAKRLQVLAVGSGKRLSQFPNAPTMSEIGSRALKKLLLGWVYLPPLKHQLPLLQNYMTL